MSGHFPASLASQGQSVSSFPGRPRAGRAALPTRPPARHPAPRAALGALPHRTLRSARGCHSVGSKPGPALSRDHAGLLAGAPLWTHATSCPTASPLLDTSLGCAFRITSGSPCPTPVPRAGPHTHRTFGAGAARPSPLGAQAFGRGTVRQRGCGRRTRGPGCRRRFVQQQISPEPRRRAPPRGRPQRAGRRADVPVPVPVSRRAGLFAATLPAASLQQRGQRGRRISSPAKVCETPSVRGAPAGKRRRGKDKHLTPAPQAEPGTATSECRFLSLCCPGLCSVGVFTANQDSELLI